MTVVHVPYVVGRLHSETFAAAVGCGFPVQFHNIDPADPLAYPRMVRRWWAAGETFVILEHDVAPDEGMIAALIDCPAPWCCQEYGGSLSHVFPHHGLVKYSKEFLAEYPHSAERGLVRGARFDKEVWWSEADSQLARDLFIRGATCHPHLPPVTHHHYGGPTPVGRPYDLR